MKLICIFQALVDYDSDEDEEDDDEDDEVCEDEDGREVCSDRQSDVSDERTSATAIASTKLSAVPNEKNKPEGTLEVDSTTKDVSVVQTETTLQSTDSISEKSAINSEKISVINSDDKKESLTEQCILASENTADTHDSEQSLAKSCNNSIVQKSVENSERQQIPSNNDMLVKEDDLKTSNATSRQDSLERQNAPLNVVHVSSDGDGKTHVSVPSLVRSNECLEDSDGGPLSKRQRLCSIEDKQSEEIKDKELSGISEANYSK